MSRSDVVSELLGSPRTQEPAAETVAEGFLMRLRAHGIQNFFVNSGTDFAPLVEAYARLRGDDEGLLPRVRVASHENLATGMAHGAYLMTGKPQVVMFHVNVGTANAVCATINAAAERVPLIVCAGRSPIYERGKLGSRNTRVTWAQEMYDQAGMVRGVVKWEYELRGGEQLAAVIDRAFAIACAAPTGPVYLTLPREVLAEPLEDAQVSRPSPVSLPSPPAPDKTAVDALADRLASAEFPVMCSHASGANPATVAVLADVCRKYAIGYVEDQARYLNIPDTHPLHLGYSLPPILRAADAICFIESEVPWVPDIAEPRPEAFIAQCGLDPLVSRYPMRSHRANLRITSGALALLEALDDALDARKDRIDPARRARIAEMAEAIRRKRAETSDAERAKTGPITNSYLSMVLQSVLDGRCMLFNEYWGVREHFVFDRPSSYFFLPATGGLGWALPAALGAKLEMPEKTCVAAVGDGTYMFSNPAACHHASQKHGLPVLTVICNNTRWNAVNATSRLVYPDGFMSKHAQHPISDLSPAPAYEEFCRACGGHGERVSERAQLAPALRRALHAVEVEKRQALVNVICA